MPYRHAGELGDVWKHLPLCDILEIEHPIRYHETNSAYSGYTISKRPETIYGIYDFMSKCAHLDCLYFRILKEKGIDNRFYTGSPGLAMRVLAGNAFYYFHDIEEEALEDIRLYGLHCGLESNLNLYCGDSIHAFLKPQYPLSPVDFVFLDPYSPFDKNNEGCNFFDVFDKALLAKSKILMWYGYDSIFGKQAIHDRFSVLASKYETCIYCFDVWQKCMTENGCEINPGVPGCGLAAVHLSIESIMALTRNMKWVDQCYAEAKFAGKEAALITKSIVHNPQPD